MFRGAWQGNDVAVKVFSSGLLTPEGMTSFKREVFVMNCLRHPNVVLLLGACQTPPKLSIIMEYVAGGSLHKVHNTVYANDEISNSLKNGWDKWWVWPFLFYAMMCTIKLGNMN